MHLPMLGDLSAHPWIRRLREKPLAFPSQAAEPSVLNNLGCLSYGPTGSGRSTGFGGPGLTIRNGNLVPPGFGWRGFLSILDGSVAEVVATRWTNVESS